MMVLVSNWDLILTYDWWIYIRPGDKEQQFQFQLASYFQQHGRPEGMHACTHDNSRTTTNTSEIKLVILILEGAADGT